MLLEDSLYIFILIFACLVQGVLLVFINLQVDMRKQTKLFRWLIICSIIICISDMLTRIASLYTQDGAYMISISYMVNEIYFISQACVAGVWFVYAQRVVNSNWPESPVKIIGAMIPMVFLIVFVVLTGATGWLFSINGMNEYQRGPLFLLHPLICMGYLLYPSVMALLKINKSDFYIHRAKLMTIAIFSALIIPFVVLQAVWGNDYPLFCIGYTLALMVLYVNRQNQRITIDELTGVSNRSQAMNYLNFKMNAHAEPGQPIKSMYLLMVDIDKFKQINDNYGHVEGDEVLKRTAAVLKRSVPRSFFIGRYGGDEFIIIGEAQKEEEIQNICEAIHENIAVANYQAMLPYNFTVSIGYSVRDGQIFSIPEFVKKADKNLYRVKKNHHEELLKESE